MKKNVKIKLSIAVYLILCLIAIIFFLLSQTLFEKYSSWSDLLAGLSIELLGVVIVFFIAQYFFIWNEEIEIRNAKLDLFLSKNEQDNHSSVFVIEKDAELNSKFYDYFNERIRKAKYDIYITGEGFDSPKSKSFAKDFVDANISALNNNVNIVRLQTSSELSEYWANHLKKLLKFPNFKMFLTDSNWSKGSLCSIDSTDQINNITEYMLSVPRTSGVVKSNLAGLAVFVRNDQELAKDVMKMIESRFNDKDLSTLITEENFDNYFQIIKNQ